MEEPSVRTGSDRVHSGQGPQVSIPSSRNRHSNNPDAKIAPGGSTPRWRRSQSPHRGTVHSNLEGSWPRTGRCLNPLIEEPSIRTQGGLNVRPPARLNPLIEEPSIRTEGGRRRGDAGVSIPSSRNRPFEPVYAWASQTPVGSPSPHRGTVHS